MQFQKGTSGNPASTFKPGQSGNPAGTSKVEAELTRLCREAGVDGYKVVIEIMKDSKASKALRLTAVAMLWDRGFGKAQQNVSLLRGSEVPTELSDAEITAILAEPEEAAGVGAATAAADPGKLN